jgi:hypothetical protein
MRDMMAADSAMADILLHNAVVAVVVARTLDNMDCRPSITFDRLLK